LRKHGTVFEISSMCRGVRHTHRDIFLSQPEFALANSKTNISIRCLVSARWGLPAGSTPVLERAKLSSAAGFGARCPPGLLVVTWFSKPDLAVGVLLRKKTGMAQGP